MSVQFAAENPDRVMGLILFGTTPRSVAQKIMRLACPKSTRFWEPIGVRRLKGHTLP